MMWTDFQAWFVYAMGDALLIGAGWFLASCFVIALLISTAWAVRNLKP